MKHRIRAAALIISDDRILLVEHRHAVTGVVWWVPPGGGLDGAESILECAAREVWEEAGLRVDLTRVVYLREFVNRTDDIHHLETFLLASSWSGSPTIDNLKGQLDEEWVRRVEFLSRDELQRLTVYPEQLKDEFWEDVAAGFPTTKYLGLQSSAY